MVGTVGEEARRYEYNYINGAFVLCPIIDGAAAASSSSDYSSLVAKGTGPGVKALKRAAKADTTYDDRWKPFQIRAAEGLVTMQRMEAIVQQSMDQKIMLRSTDGLTPEAMVWLAQEQAGVMARQRLLLLLSLLLALFLPGLLHALALLLALAPALLL